MPEMNRRCRRRTGPIVRMISLVVWIIFFLTGICRGEDRQNRQVIVVGGDHHFPPYEFVDQSGEPAGFNIDLTREWARLMGVELSFRLGPWTQARKALETGKIDMLAGMFMSDQRDRVLDFSTPHTIVHHAVFIRKGSPGIQSIEELVNKRVIVQRGDIMHDDLGDRGWRDQIVLVESPLEALRTLASGQYDCALVGRLQGLYLTKKYDLNNLTTTGPLLHPRKYCFTVAEGNDSLLGQLNEGLSILQETGTYQVVYDRWFGPLEPRKITLPVLLRYGVLILAPILLLLVGASLWSWLLRKRVTRRTLELREEIENHKKTEEDLRKSQQRFRLALEATKDGLWENDFGEDKHFFSDRMFSMLGYDPMPPDKAFHFFFEILHPEDAPYFKREYNGLMNDPDKSNYSSEFRLKAKDGTWKNILARGQCIERDENGKAVRVIGTHTDMTDLKKAENAVRERDERLRAIFEAASSVAFIITDTEIPHPKILEFSPGAENLFGYRREEILGRSVGILHPPEFKEKFTEIFKRMKRGHLGFTGESFIVKKSGRKVPALVSIHPLLDHEGELSSGLGVVIDISELKKLESQLRQAQKMEAIGTLAGGIAHDFNNLLGIIIGHADLLFLNMHEGDPTHDRLKEIREAAGRAAALTRQLLTFSRKQIVEPRIRNLNDTIEKTKKMLGPLIGEDVELKTVLEPSLWPVLMDQTQMEQILVNLAVNARDAMAKGGSITIETANRDLDTSFFEHRNVDGSSGSYVMLKVTDTGVGMDESVRTRIFEPFFSTKERGRGTGLGLATVYGIVKQAQGFILVDSSPGEGTAFEIYLPRAEHGESPKTGDHHPIVELGGQETVLVVEDDAGLRNLIKKILDHYGYRVLLARNAETALTVGRTYEGSIDLLLSDVVMPGMNGIELVRKYRDITPQIKILLISGYPDDNIARYGPLEPGTEFLGKPFTPTGLAHKIRQVLSGS